MDRATDTREATTGGRGGGRPRDPLIDRTVLEATLKLLDEAGYADLTLEEVARRAGTSRPAIYRRWAGRPALVLAAVSTRLEVPPPPDTGCTLCDIEESFNVFLAAYRTIRPDVLCSLYIDCALDPELNARYLATVIEPSRRAVGRTLDRAVARGDLRADVDREQLLSLIASLVHYRALFDGEHISDLEAERVIDMLLQGAAVDYPALVAHSESLEHVHSGEGGRHRSHRAT